MNVGLDDVALNATTVTPPPVPEPRSVALLLAALAVMGVFTRRRLGAIRHQGKLLAVLGAFALLSQPVHAQSANQAQAVVPKAGLEPGNSRPYAWMVSIVDPAAVVPGPGQTNCGGGAGQDTCFYLRMSIQRTQGLSSVTVMAAREGRSLLLTPILIARRKLI